MACHACHQSRGGLLPHLFTLTRQAELPGGLFSVPLSVALGLKWDAVPLCPYGAWPLASILPAGVRTFLRVAPATVRPAPAGNVTPDARTRWLRGLSASDTAHRHSVTAGRRHPAADGNPPCVANHSSTLPRQARTETGCWRGSPNEDLADETSSEARTGWRPVAHDAGRRGGRGPGSCKPAANADRKSVV